MTAATDSRPATEPAPISGLVPMIHVAEMERSVTFYRLIGFEIGNYVPREGPMHWAWLYAPKAADWKRGPNLMLTRSPGPIDRQRAGSAVLPVRGGLDVPAEPAVGERCRRRRDRIPRLSAERRVPCAGSGRLHADDRAVGARYTVTPRLCDFAFRMRRLVILIALTGAACSANARGDMRRFQLTGVVVGRETSPPRIVVAHDAVDGLMPAMSMAFETATDSPAVRDGDRIRATLVLSGTTSWLEDVRITVPGGAVGMRGPAAGRAMPARSCPTYPWSIKSVGACRCATSPAVSWSSPLSIPAARCPLSVR